MKPGKYLFFEIASKYERYRRYQELEILEVVPGYIKYKFLSGFIEWTDQDNFDKIYEICAELNQKEGGEG